MKKYLVVYYAPAEAMAKMATSTPEEQKAGMAEWAKWKERNGDSIVEMGEPIMLGQGTKDGNNWQNSTKQVSGYSVVQAENMDAAKKYLKIIRMFIGIQNLKSEFTRLCQWDKKTNTLIIILSRYFLSLNSNKKLLLCQNFTLINLLQ